MNNKNKLLLSITIVSSCAVMGTVLATGGAFNKNDTLAVTRGSEIWHHYAEVPATEDHYGSKEFWAKESEGCTKRYFSAPGGDYVEHNFSTYDEYATLTYGHELYVPSLFDQRNGVYPINNGGGTFTYGVYPKTKINDATLLTSLNGLDDSYIQSNGWYLYNGTHYVKKDTNWFKCDVINWIIMNNYGNGEYLLLSENALDVHRYDDDSSNYETSEIRAFLNDETYTKAFHLNNSYVKTVNSNKLYILESGTMRDFFNSGDNYPKRLCPLTDWLSANSAYSYGGNVCYWSSYAHDGSSVYRFDTNGSSTGWESVSNETFCVRPAMTLKLS